ncbi:hypothetical protein SELMODRAFT_403006 [Selaginella moellendorffii]|uniref:Uncharacterized protein n=1 Tax=Selaginella moellendorffii TaxID=88036 RepID=D8QNR5_SELML|nr:hypothetical protein SELMODRAFT_403006 [Selaginella moellendorffii]
MDFDQSNSSWNFLWSNKDKSNFCYGAAVTPTLTPQPVSGSGAAGTSTHAQATPDSKDDLAVLLNTDSSSNWRVKQPKLKTKDPDVQKELNELAGFKHTEYQLTLLSLLLDARKKELVISSGQVKNACRTFGDHLLDIVLTALQDISNPSSRSLLQRELATMVYAKRDLFVKDVVFAQANRRLQEQNRQNAEDARLAAQDKAKLLS